MLAPRQRGAHGWPRVLVADDDARIGQLVSALLRRAGVETMVVGDGIAALTVLTQPQRFTCALMDVDMPGLDGVDVARALAACLPDLPVVLMSGRDEREVRGRLGGLPVAAVLTKPFGGPELLAALSEAAGMAGAAGLRERTV